MNATLSTFETNKEKQESTKDHIKRIMGKYHGLENTSPNKVEYLLENRNNILKENKNEQNNTLSENPRRCSNTT